MTTSGSCFLHDPYWNEGRYRDSLDAINNAVTEARASLTQNGDTKSHVMLASALNDQVFTFLELDRVSDAMSCAEEALAMCEQSLSDALGNWAHELCYALANTGKVCMSHGDDLAALAAFERALSLCEQLVSDDPEDRSHRRELAIALANLGRFWERQCLDVQALKAHERSVAIYEQLIAEAPTSGTYSLELAWELQAVGRVCDKLPGHEPTKSMDAFEKARRLCESLALEDADNLSLQLHLAIACYRVGRAARLMGDHPRALQQLIRARELATRLSELGAVDPGTDPTLFLRAVHRELRMVRIEESAS